MYSSDTTKGYATDSCGGNCSIGQYSESNAIKCTACPKGYFGPALGLSRCTACSAGTYSSAIDAHSCSTSCPAGYFSQAGAEACTDCSQGWYQDGLSTSACKSCVAGRYADTRGMIACKSCLAGKYGADVEATSSTSCNDCPAGYHIPIPGTSEVVLPTHHTNISLHEHHTTATRNSTDLDAMAPSVILCRSISLL